jgi:hypothetical protein
MTIISIDRLARILNDNIEANKIAFEHRHGIERPTLCAICGKFMATSALTGEEARELTLYCSSVSLKCEATSHYQVSPDGSWLFYMPLHGQPSFRVMTAYRDVAVQEDYLVAQRKSTIIEPPARNNGPNLVLSEPLTIEQHCDEFLTAEKIELLRLFQ